MSDTPFKVAIITSSDTGYAGEREDKSAPVIEKFVTEAGYDVVEKILLPDDKEMLSAAMAKICDENSADLILTSYKSNHSPRSTGYTRSYALVQPADYRPCNAYPCSSRHP